MGKETVNPVQEVQKVSGMLNPRRNTLRHIVIKLTKNKDKDKILKATREEKTNNIHGKSHKIISRFLDGNSTSQKGMA